MVSVLENQDWIYVITSAFLLSHVEHPHSVRVRPMAAKRLLTSLTKLSKGSHCTILMFLTSRL